VSAKSIPLSVRLSVDDADFLSSLERPGTTTPSDKIRALVAEARRQHDGSRSYAEGIVFQDSQVAPLVRTLWTAERDSDQHSELLFAVLSWLPEIQAYLQAELAPDAQGRLDPSHLQMVEEGVARRVVGLAEAVLRLSIARPEPCYDPVCISRRLGPVLQLSDLIRSHLIPLEEEDHE
jgi:hypothetical protein